MPWIQTNIGHLDRALRIVVGLLLIALAAKGTVGLWGYLGVVPLLTGVVGNCPLYALFGFSTRPKTPPGPASRSST